MQALENCGLLDVVMRTVREKPFFGMCIGPQALMQQSEENGGVQCLGVIPGQVLKFPSDLRDSITGVRLKIPHMGWNRVWQTQKHIFMERYRGWCMVLFRAQLLPQREGRGVRRRNDGARHHVSGSNTER